MFTQTDVECFGVHIPHRNISGCSEYFHRECEYQSSPFILWDQGWYFSWTSGACKECIQPLMKAVQNRCSRDRRASPSIQAAGNEVWMFQTATFKTRCGNIDVVKYVTGWVSVGMCYNSSIRREKGEEPKSVLGRLSKLFFKTVQCVIFGLIC